MPYNFLLLPLIGGYWFAVVFNRTRYLATRQTRDRLLLLAATIAVALTFTSYVATRLISHALPQLAVSWKALAPWPYSGTAVGALVLGWLLPRPLNWCWFSEPEENVRAIRRYGNSLERLFCEATDTGELIMVTTGDRKVYIGYPKWIPPLHGDDSFLRILPIQSGYRDAEGLSVALDTNYSEVYEQIINNVCKGPLRDEIFDKFVKVLPVASIVSAGLFDPDDYDRFRKTQGLAENDLSAA